MLTLLKIIFFGTWVTLTENPIVIGNTPYLISLQEPISAITFGAHLRIDITHHVPPSNVIAQLNLAKAFMPKSCLVAQLATIDGKTYIFDELGQSAGNESTELSLSNKGGVPTGVEFTSVTVESCKPIERAVVTWANYIL